MAARAPHNRGFTLVEMLVAMAILTTVISGVVLLYIGAVDTTRNTFKAIDNFEIGRSVLAAIERDIERSFAARDFGKYYQFHGAPDGFMYIGTLSTGNLGRVTYAVTRLDDENDFVMLDTQPLRLVIERAMSQFDGQLGTFPDVAKNFTLNLLQLLALDNNIKAGTLSQADILRLLPLAAQNGINIDSNTFPVGFTPPWQLRPLVVEDPPGSGSFVSFDDATVEAEVRVLTGHMVRYEEPGVSDISTFELPPDPDRPGLRFTFPTIDPVSTEGLRNNPTFSELESICGGNSGGYESVTATGQAALDCYTWSAILMPATGAPRDSDLRRIVSGESIYAEGNPASYITPRTVNSIFEAAKREAWIDLFTGGGIAPLVFTKANGQRWASNFFEAWTGDDGITGTPQQIQEARNNNKDPFDYVIADRIVVAGRLVTYQDVNTLDPIFFQQLLNFDYLGVPSFFTYADLDGEYRETYNTLDDIPGYAPFADPAFPAPSPEDRFISFDEALGVEMTGIPTVASQGSPIAPRIPALVSPRFWIMSEGATATSPPFKRFFEQVIEVPTSARRSLPRQFTPNSG